LLTHTAESSAVAVAFPRPELRRLDSRTQDPSTRRNRSNSAYHRQAATQLTERFASARASVTSSARALSDVEDGASCPCPLSAAPRASQSFTAGSPEGRRPLDLEDALFLEPFTISRPLRARVAAAPLSEHDLAVRCRIGRGIDWLAPAARFGPAPSRGASRWWAPLSPGGPSLLGFSSFSKLLLGASSRRRVAYTPFGVKPLRT